MSLFWRVFAANAAILIVGTLALVVYPGPLHEHRALFDLVVLLIALLVMVVVNGLLLRHLFRPLQRLAERMEAADVLRGGQRLPVDSAGEIGALERTFNRMLDRLEKERRDAGAHALQAQEEERQRLARGLHDEVGQSMTAVLLQLKRLAANASPEQRTQLAEAQEVVKTSLDDVAPPRPGTAPRTPRSPRACQRARGTRQWLRAAHARARPATARARLAAARPAGGARPLPCRPGELDERRPSRPGQSRCCSPSSAAKAASSYA